jgi:hypothetical protein
MARSVLQTTAYSLRVQRRTVRGRPNWKGYATDVGLCEVLLRHLPERETTNKLRIRNGNFKHTVQNCYRLSQMSPILNVKARSLCDYMNILKYIFENL